LPALLAQLTKNPAGSAAKRAPGAALDRLGLLGLDLAKRSGDWDLGGPLTLQAEQVDGGAGATATILWKTPLEAEAITTPVVLQAAGRAAVLVQDAKNQLYCLEVDGDVRWRRQLPGPLLSTVHGIDYFGNGNLHFLFNTAESIWVIDEEGNDLEGYPFRLQTRATNGVAVADFDGNKRYSFFIACANGNVYGYDQFGRPLQGWNPQAAQGRITHPLLHFQRADKDFICALNAAGRLSVYGRNGERRFSPVAWAGARFLSPLQADTAPRAARIVAFDARGRAHICNLEGGSFSLDVGPDGGGTARGALAALGGDARAEYAVLAGQSLRVGGYAGSSFRTVFSHHFPATQDTLFALPGRRLGTLSREKRQVHLLDAQGKVAPGFPLGGTTAFTVSRLGRPGGEEWLLVGLGAQIYAYKL
jgi:hypothetical protein